VASAVTTKEKRQQGCRSPKKRKSPDWHRGALSYTNKSATLVLTLSSRKCIIYKLLKKRALVCDKGGAVVVDKTKLDAHGGSAFFLLV
jgi:hypothetical protein